MSSDLSVSSVKTATLPAASKKKAKKGKKGGKQEVIEKTEIVAAQTDLSASKEVCDPNECFFKVKIYASNNPMQPIILCIPAKLLPDPIRSVFIREKSSALLQEATLSWQERIKKWRKAFECLVYEVETLEPLRIQGMKTIDFKKKYELTNIKEAINRQFGINESTPQKLTIRKQKVLESTNLEVKAQIDQIQYVDHEDVSSLLTSENGSIFFKEFPVIHLKLQDLKMGLSSVVNRFGSKLFPDEPMRLVWDSLAQLILKNYCIDEDAKKRLSGLLLDYWEGIHWSIYNYFQENCANELDRASLHLNEAINQLRNLRGFLESNNEEIILETIIKPLEEMQLPLVSFLEFGSQLQSPEGKGRFFNVFFESISQNLGDWCQRTVRLDASRKQIRKWLEARADILETYLKKLIPKESKFSHFLDDYTRIRKALLEQNWIAAYQEMSHFTDVLRQLCLPKNIIRVNFTIFPETMTREEYLYLRCFHFMKHLKLDFETIVKNGKLYNVMSEKAYEELRKSFKTLLLPVSKTEIAVKPFVEWAKQLNQNGYPEIFEALEGLQSCWSQLLGVKKEICSDGTLKEELEKLLKNVDAEEYANLSKDYLRVYDRVLPTFKQWESALQKINDRIRKTQDVTLLVLTDPTLPFIDVMYIYEQFIQLNDLFGELIKPITHFFNAFQKLICMDKTSFKVGKDEAITLSFTEEGSFTLNLFETDVAYFKNLAKQLEPLRQEQKAPVLEVEENCASSPAEISAVSTEQIDPQMDLKAKLDSVFQDNTKTRKIMKDVQQLLKEYRLPFTTKFGKGDHNKLYVNGRLIVFPEHKEWKPTTLRSIQKMFEQVLTLIDQQKTQEAVV